MTTFCLLWNARHSYHIAANVFFLTLLIGDRHSIRHRIFNETTGCNASLFKPACQWTVISSTTYLYNYIQTCGCLRSWPDRQADRPTMNIYYSPTISNVDLCIGLMQNYFILSENEWSCIQRSVNETRYCIGNRTAGFSESRPKNI